MLKRLFVFLSAVLTVFGSIVGAGFISGKEINAFFGSDFSVGGLYAAFLFFSLFIFFLMLPREGNGTERVLSVLISVSNVVVSSCMLSALKTLLNPVFRLSENNLIFPVLFAISAFFICGKGVRAISLFSLVSMPLVIAVLLLIIAGAKADNSFIKISPYGAFGAAMPVLYVGINCVLSSSVISDLGKETDVKTAAAISFASAFIIVLFVFLLLRVFIGNTDEMPVLSFAKGGVFGAFFIYFSVFSAVFSTLLSSFSSAMKLRPEKREKAWGAVIVCVCVFLSRFPFSGIVEKLYPVIGVFGTAYFIVLVFSSSFFREGRRARTFPPLKRRELRCSPSRGRV